MYLVQSVANEIKDNLENTISTWDVRTWQWQRIALHLVAAVVIFIVGSQIIRIARKLLASLLKKKAKSKAIVYVLDILVKVTLYFILITIIAGTLGMQTTSLVALLGSAGLAIGLALQGSLSDLAAGIMIIVLRPIRYQDIVHLDSLDTRQLTVKEIRLFHTVFLDLTKAEIIVPNGQLIKKVIINLSKEEKIRLEFKIDIAYGAKIDQARAIIREVLAKEPKIFHDLGYQVDVLDLSNSSVTFICRAFILAEDNLRLKFKLQEEIKKEFDRQQVEIPFPQMDVWLRQNPDN